MTNPPIQLFSADLDGTLLGLPRATDRFVRAWNGIDPSRRPWLVYNTGRGISDVQSLIERKELPMADAIIGGVGTELHVPASPRLAVEFRSRFGERWNLSDVERIVAENPRITRQPPEFLHPYKSSWIWPRASVRDRQELQKKLRLAGTTAVIVYSSDRFLDVLPECGNKGQALHWLCQRLGIPFSQVLVAGDTGNDSSMFRLEGVQRLLVGNALPELLADCVGFPKYESREIMADGVLEGLLHFGVIERLPRAMESGELQRPFFLNYDHAGESPES